MLKHLFLLPGYLIRLWWNILFLLGGLKNMGDAQKFLASNTRFGLVVYSIAGWIGILVLAVVVWNHQPTPTYVSPPQAQAEPSTAPQLGKAVPEQSGTVPIQAVAPPAVPAPEAVTPNPEQAGIAIAANPSLAQTSDPSPSAVPAGDSPAVPALPNHSDVGAR